MRKLTFKILSVLLILLLTLTNLVLLFSYFSGNNKTYAMVENLEKQSRKTNFPSVEFDAYFLNNKEITHGSKVNISQEDNKLYFDIHVKDGGYLKDIEIALESDAEENPIPWKISDRNSENEIITKLTDNKINVNQINGNRNITVELWIEPNIEGKINLSALVSSFKIKLNSIYVDINGVEHNVQKEINLFTELTAESDLKIEEQIVKFIPYQEGTLIQTLVSVKNNKENKLPLKETNLEIEIPSLNEKLPQKVMVLAKSLGLTCGQEDDLKEFYQYQLEGNRLKIKSENLEEEGKVNLGRGIDQYLITYIYDEKIKKTDWKNKINADFVFYHNEKIHKDYENNTLLEHKINEIISTNIEGEKEINKGKLYANLVEENNYETIYHTNWTINIGVKEFAKEITLKERETFLAENGNEYKTSSYYKETKIARENFNEILGENGWIAFLHDGKEIKRIDKNTAVNNEDYYYITYEEGEQEKLEIKLSEAIQEGDIKLEHTKVIKKVEKIVIENAVKIKSEIQTITNIATHNVTMEIPLTETITKSDIYINKTEWVKGKENEDVEIKIVLNNHLENSDFYNNPKFEIEFPEEIFNVEVKTASILFGENILNGNVEKEIRNYRTVLIVDLFGMQKKINASKITGGTNIILNTDIEVNENILKEKEIDISLKYKNIGSKRYDNEVQENEETYGISNTKIKISIPYIENEIITESEQNANINVEEPLGDETNENVNATLEILGIKENYVVENQIVSYEIKVENKENSLLQNVKVIAPIPEGTVFVDFDEEAGTAEEPGDYVEDETKKELEILIPEIATGETYSYQYEVKVNQGTAEISNQCKVIFGEQEILSNVITKEVRNALYEIRILEDSVQKISPGKVGYFEFETINISNETQENIQVIYPIPEGIEVEEAILVGEDEEGNIEIPMEIRGNTIYWSIENWNVNEYFNGAITVKVKRDSLKEKYNNIIMIEDSNGYTHVSNNLQMIKIESKIQIEKTSSTNNKFVEPGDEIDYTIRIKNKGTEEENNFTITDVLPEQLEFIKLSYTNSISAGSIFERDQIENGIMKINTDIAIDGEIVIHLKAKVKEDVALGDTITNIAQIEMTDGYKIESNPITHFVDRKDQSKYNIQGLAWNDENQNGRKETNETTMSGITVYLLNYETGEILKTTTTNEQGEYIFSELGKGNYQILFEYDFEKYYITSFTKHTLNGEVTSNAIEIDYTNGNEKRLGGITEEIIVENQNISNLNLGLIERKIFDLSLEKYISKVTVQTQKQTKTYEFGKEQLAKVEIHSKEISGANVLIEYKIAVKNEGEVLGTVNKIVDYMPEDMFFSQELNPNWYMGEDGNLYNEELANTEIEPNETKEVTLTLSKAMTNTNTGTVTNIAEINEDYNQDMLKDKDSTPANQVQDEDDISIANCIITISTGTYVYYIILAITIVAVLILGIIAIKKYVLG